MPIRSQTLFLVTDGAALNDLMAMNGCAGHGSASASSWSIRGSGAGRSTYSREAALDPRSPLKGWVRWAGSTSPDVRNRAAAALAAPGLSQRHL